MWFSSIHTISIPAIVYRVAKEAGAYLQQSLGEMGVYPGQAASPLLYVNYNQT